jgi:hypothetical protein
LSRPESWFTRARLESLAAFAASFAAAWLISRNLLRPGVFSADAFVHQFWMWHFRDPQLFNDSLTEELRGSARYPEGYVALFRVFTQLTSPIVFGEWLGVALMAASGWLVWAIVREHSSWRPAAWIAAGLFLALIDIHRFYGGFPRAFVHPVVLLTVLLAMKRQHLAAAVVAVAGALFYPTAALLATGVLLVSSLGWADRRPRIERPRVWFALLALAGTVVAILGPALASGGSPEVFTADEARRYPEFGVDGALNFFVPDTIEYLRQNRSGFDLRGSGSALALAALFLLLVRPANLRLLRREVLALPIVALAGWGAAQAVLFQLYLPHRYTYPLLAFFAIVVGVTLRPTWTAMWSRPRPRLRAFLLFAAVPVIFVLAVYVFPLGSKKPLEDNWLGIAIAAGGVALSAAVALLLRRAPERTVPAVGAAVTALALGGAMLGATDEWARGTRCPGGPAIGFLANTPKDSVIAGDPMDMKCLPGTTRRAVVISTQLAPSYEVDYFLRARERMFASLRAYYGQSIASIAELADRYDATHLWVRRDSIEKVMTHDGAAWRYGDEPYGTFIRGLLHEGEPVVLHLPQACMRFKRGPQEVYDIRCIAAEVSR